MSTKSPKHRGGKNTGAQPRQGSVIAPDEPLSPDAGLLKVALRFFGIYAILQLATWYVAYLGYFDAVVQVTARITGACSRLTGVPAIASGYEVFLASRVLRIDVACTGISLMLIYAALVLAYPLGIERKLIGLLVGLPVLAVVNVLRLTAVAQLSGRLNDKAFYFVHDFLFEAVMAAAVIVLWGLYLAWAKRHAR